MSQNKTREKGGAGDRNKRMKKSENRLNIYVYVICVYLKILHQTKLKRDRQTDRQRRRETDRQRNTESDRDRDRQTGKES